MSLLWRGYYYTWKCSGITSDSALGITPGKLTTPCARDQTQASKYKASTLPIMLSLQTLDIFYF